MPSAFDSPARISGRKGLVSLEVPLTFTLWGWRGKQGESLFNCELAQGASASAPLQERPERVGGWLGMAGCKAVAKLAADCLFLPRDYVDAGVGRRNEAKAPSRKRLFPSWLELKRIPPAAGLQKRWKPNGKPLYAALARGFDSRTLPAVLNERRDEHANSARTN